MQPLLKSLWTEPAVFLGAVNIVLNAAQILLVHEPGVNAVIAAVIAGISHLGVRTLVTPNLKRPVR